MPVYCGWGTVVCGPAVVGIESGNGQFELGDDEILGITVLIKELDAYGMPFRFPGRFLRVEAIGKDGALGRRLARPSNRPQNRGWEGIDVIIL